MIPLRHILQEENTSCVPASVRMVLAALGIERSELEISAALGTTKEGTSVWNTEVLTVIGCYLSQLHSTNKSFPD